jgi:hypothetical protein
MIACSLSEEWPSILYVIFGEVQWSCDMLAAAPTKKSSSASLTAQSRVK